MNATCKATIARIRRRKSHLNPGGKGTQRRRKKFTRRVMEAFLIYRGFLMEASIHGTAFLEVKRSSMTRLPRSEAAMRAVILANPDIKREALNHVPTGEPKP